MFKPLQYDSGKIKSLVMDDDATVSKGDALQFSSGVVKRAESDTYNVRFVSLEDKTTAASETTTEILCLDVRGVEFEADCTNNTGQDQVGTANALTDHGYLANTNNEGSGEDTFVITQLVGADTDKKVRGYFMDKIIGS